MNFEEKPLRFQCLDSTLFGILGKPKVTGKRGILIVVGGPQYRAGSHRQFTLLARQFASDGIPVMRFDYRGMGDSEGDPREFASTDDDIRAAVDCFFDEIPELQEVVLWGLCDAASAAVFYAPNDRRVAGLVLLNPWVRSEQGIAKAYLKHYYLARLLDPQLWRKIFTGKFAFFSALHSLAQQISRLVFKPKGAQTNTDNGPLNQGVTHLPKKFEEDLRRFKGRSLFILCDNDLTAQEFSDLSQSSDGWKKLMASSQVSKRNVEGANHTFSQRDWREKIGQWTIDWVKED